jgi:stage V sporulation protein SpoVS
LVGASALNQAIKACIVARRFLKDDETPSDIAIQPEFLMQNFSEPAAPEAREVTTIMLHIKRAEFDPANAVSSDVPKHEEVAE